MAPPFIGVGYLTVNDILTDAAFALIEPSVDTSFPVTILPGPGQTVNAFDPAMYVGAKLVVGVDPDIEVVVITATNPGFSFTASFVNGHSNGDPIVGATFPVRHPTDPFFTQDEMLGYVATAQNDFLTDCPLSIGVGAATVAPTLQNTALPADCMKPVRVGAYGVPLRETSQSNLDIDNYRWQQAAATGPYTYFRDKVGVGNLGIYPRANNTTPLEIVYERRGASVVDFADGFLVPDPFLLYVLCRVLEYAYSKDGEQRNPGLARYYNGRYTAGVQISTMLLEAVMDPNLQMEQ